MSDFPKYLLTNGFCYGYWSCDDLSGPTVTENRYSGWDLTASGGVTFDSGSIFTSLSGYTSLHFDGTTGYADSDIFPSGQNVTTLMVLVELDSIIQQPGTFLSLYDSGTDRSISLSLTAAELRLSFIQVPGVTQKFLTATYADLGLANFYGAKLFVVARWNFQTENYELFVNNVFCDSSNSNSPLTYDLGKGRILLGGKYSSGGGIVADCACYISKVALLSHEVSDSYINKLYQELVNPGSYPLKSNSFGTQVLSEPDLLSFYRMQDTGSVMVDSSIGSNDGAYSATGTTKEQISILDGITADKSVFFDYDTGGYANGYPGPLIMDTGCIELVVHYLDYARLAEELVYRRYNPTGSYIILNFSGNIQIQFSDGVGGYVSLFWLASDHRDLYPDGLDKRPVHIVIAWDRLAPYYGVLVDGVEILSDTTTVMSGAFRGDIFVIAGRDFGTPEARWEGWIDEIALYSSILPQATIDHHVAEIQEAGSFVLSGIPALDIQQAVVPPFGTKYLRISQEVVYIEQPSLPISIQVINVSNIVSLQVQQDVIGYGGIDLPVTQRIYNPLINPLGQVWTLSVILNGVDVSVLLTGDWSIDAEEDGARVAEFSIMPNPGILNPVDDWLHKEVTIDFVDMQSDGSINWTTRLFTGKVDEPTYDAAEGIATIVCTDNMQNRIKQASRTSITNEVGGYWSKFVFDEDADNFTYMQDRLSTIPASYDLDVYRTGWLRNWKVMGNNFATHDENSVIYGSLSVTFAEANSLQNKVDISSEFRFQRLRQRDVNFVWKDSINWCTWLLDPYPLLQKSMVRQAAEGTGWDLQAISFTDPPPPGLYNCFDRNGMPYQLGWGFVGGFLTYAQSNLDDFCREAYFRVAKRWAQTITETYNISVYSPQSISLVGEIKEELSVGIEAKQDTQDWEMTVGYQGPRTGARLLAIGEYVFDVTSNVDGDRAEFDNAVIIMQSIAKRNILETHRHNYVTWRTTIMPDLERHYDMEIDTARIQAIGKVYRIVHQGSFDTGEAITEITVALSRSTDTPVVDTEITALVPPNTDPAVDSLPYIGLLTHVGGTGTAVAFNEEWTGYITNYIFDPLLSNSSKADDPQNPDTELYPQQFRVKSPDISEEDRATNYSTSGKSVFVDIPNDFLVITQ